mmetsp:Transcript_9784/g.14709  ORF Transcript_9784/g.14709 Transcript_9784/m.14709 type:complete len:190 (-) Transcript_9784:352-921(-)
MTTTAMHTTKEAILSFLSTLVVNDDEQSNSSMNTRSFLPSKSLTEKDHVLIDMLNSQGHEEVSYCICDPDATDMPIIFASDGFCNFTGYAHDEIEGRNCRFLQGPNTAKDDVDRIRMAIKGDTEANVNLLNYRKDGTTFVNQFFLAPLHARDEPSKVVYHIGVQTCVPDEGPGQMIANPGWVYTQGNHA